MKKDLFLLLFKNAKNNRKNFTGIDSEQTQRLVEIGDQLRQTRQQHSLSLDMVATYTRIRSHLLQALEEGRMDNLPEPVYTQGLIRRYGEALGLNGEELANFFLPEPPPETVQPKIRTLPLPQLRPTHLYLTYTLLIICAINGVSYLNKSSNPTTASNTNVTTPGPEASENPLREAVVNAQTQKTQSRLVSTPAASSSSNSVVTTVEKPPSSQSAKPTEKEVAVEIVVKEESWVLIEVDGKTEFEGTLSGGTQRSWKAKEKLVVVAGNAGGVLVTVNNGEAKRLGEPGTVEEVIFEAGKLSES